MAKLKKEEFIAALKEMTILEIKELVDAMHDELGIDLTPVAAAPTSAPAPEAVENSNKTVVLKSAGGNKIAVIKIIKEVTGLGLVESKAIADNGGNIKENIPVEEAEQLKDRLTEAGAEIELT